MQEKVFKAHHVQTSLLIFTLTFLGPCDPSPLGVIASTILFRPSSMLPIMAYKRNKIKKGYFIFEGVGNSRQNSKKGFATLQMQPLLFAPDHESS